MGSQENSFDLSKLKKYFTEYGFNLIIMQFCDIDYADNVWHGTPVLYTSLEDPELYYKSFIEDVVLGLEMAGAWLLPCYYYLRAHHNKVFLEVLRKNKGFNAINNIHSTIYGVPSECKARIDSFKFPLVLKPAAGASSTGVTLVNNETELLETIDRISKVNYPILSKKVKQLHSFVRRVKRSFRPFSTSSNKSTLVTYRNKFIVQQFVRDLNNDYKILIYGDKYYVLKRDNRENDFRASGSGHLSWPALLPKGILDYAKEIYDHFDVPYVSLDIANNGREYFLIEFQFLMFGTFTLEKSPYYFQKISDEWIKIDGFSEIEKEFVSSVCDYISRKS